MYQDRLDFAELGLEPESDRIARNDKFCEIMLAAIELGLENPPIIGIDTRPCTKNPRFVPHRIKEPLIASSVAGAVADAGR